MRNKFHLNQCFRNRVDRHKYAHTAIHTQLHTYRYMYLAGKGLAKCDQDYQVVKGGKEKKG